MFKWLNKRKARVDPELDMIDVKKLNITTEDIMSMANLNSGMITSTITSGNVTGNITAAANPGVMAQTVQMHTVGNIGIGTITPQYIFQPPANIISISSNTKEIVRITRDGEVVWADGYEINEAAEAFGKSIQMGAEMTAGIRANTKQQIRDAVFAELIDMAEKKGTLTAEDLTFMWQSAKIMDKLKGII
jgi:hypothetical protein